MADETKVTPDSPSGAANAGPSEKALALVNAIEAAKQGSGSGQSSEAGAGTAAVDEIEADFGGVRRKMKVSELTAAYLDRERTKQMHELVDTRLKTLANSDALAALHDAISGASPEAKQRIMLILKGQGDPADEQEAETESEDDPIPGYTAPKTARNGKARDPRDVRMAELEGAVKELGGIVLESRQEKMARAREERVDAVLDSIRDFQGNDDAREQVKEHALMALAIDPRADIEAVVTKSAQKLQKALTRARDGVFEDVTGTGVQRLPTPTPEGKPFTGADLSKGNIRQAAMRMMQSLRK
jgi:hypothetical protein